MRIISRYIARDIFAAIVSVALVLLLIILGKLFIDLLDEVLEGDLTANMLGTVLLLGVIRYLVILLPFAAFIATVMVLGRMHKDSEINAAMAGGASNKDIMQAVMSIGLPVTAVLFVLVSYTSPWASRLAEMIENVTEQSMAMGQLSPGKFFEMENAGWVIYAQEQDAEDGTLHRVFMQREIDGKLSVEVARLARIQQSRNLSSVLVLVDGKTLEGNPGKADFAISTYDEHHISPPQTDFSGEAGKAKYLNINTLFMLSGSTYVAEILQRASIVFSTLILLLMAIPLSKVNPDSGRFSRLVWAALIYILYMNLVIVACSAIEQEHKYGLPLLISVHFFVVVITFLGFQKEWWKRLKQMLLPGYNETS